MTPYRVFQTSKTAISEKTGLEYQYPVYEVMIMADDMSHEQVFMSDLGYTEAGKIVNELAGYTVYSF